jgi:glyceraldehyde 3-phosphate dehydrogenase
MAIPNREQHLKAWNDQLTAAEHMVPLIGTLWRERHVPTYIYGAPLYQRAPIEIIRAHRAARQLIEEPLLTSETLPYLQAVAELDLSPARIDLGKLLVRHRARADEDLAGFVARELEAATKGAQPLRQEPQDVVLYGFGRVGRLLARILIERLGGGDKFRLKAIVLRQKGAGDLAKRASLLRRDSVHGPFDGTIGVDEASHCLIVNGNVIQLIDSSAPDTVDYEAHDIRGAIVIDNTGKWRDREGLSLHLKARGADKVILTAPGKGDVPNIVVGVNHDDVTDDENIVSAASCTTNAICPLLKVVHDEFTVLSGHIESCHAFTNDQNLIDNFHPKKRRGRSAALNMVITETGAAKAVGKALPALAGKLTGSAIRVPTPNVSLAILTLRLEKTVTKDAINEAIRQRSLSGSMQYQIDYTRSPDVVSSDIIGSRAAVVFDSDATIVHDEHVVLYGWYDNEYGYACQVIRLMERIAGVKPQTYPRG